MILAQMQIDNAVSPVSETGSVVAVAIFLTAIALFLAATFILSHIFSPRRRGPVKAMPYESGMDPVGEARYRINPRFYLIALIFLLFDVELAFFYPWARLLGSGELPSHEQTILFVGMIGFAGLLILAYLYAWLKGAFRWP